LNEVLRSDRPDGGIIKLFLPPAASHTDAPMLIRVATVGSPFLGVFSGADGRKPGFFLGKNL